MCNLGNSDGVSGYIKIRENSFKHPMHRECAKNIPTYFSDEFIINMRLNNFGVARK